MADFHDIEIERAKRGLLSPFDPNMRDLALIHVAEADASFKVGFSREIRENGSFETVQIIACDKSTGVEKGVGMLILTPEQWKSLSGQVNDLLLRNVPPETGSMI